ncbi:MAG TPA: hypothetical protein VKQ29_03830 [Aliidongia sp.]|nr:hypothetical protein [Aliidongia sp.]
MFDSSLSGKHFAFMLPIWRLSVSGESVMGFVAILVSGIGRVLGWLAPEPSGSLQPIPVRVRDQRPRRRR